MPDQTTIEQLDLPKDQGIIVNHLLPDSAAARAGVKVHDIILEVDGKTVPSKLDEFGKLLADIKPKAPVDLVVLRKGRKETVKGLSLPETPQTVPPVLANPGVPNPGFPNPGLPVRPAVPVTRASSLSMTMSNDMVTCHFRDDDGTVMVRGRARGRQVQAGPHQRG